MRRPLERERVSLDCGRRTPQLKRNPLGGPDALYAASNSPLVELPPLWPPVRQTAAMALMSPSLRSRPLSWEGSCPPQSLSPADRCVTAVWAPPGRCCPNLDQPCQQAPLWRDQRSSSPPPPRLSLRSLHPQRSYHPSRGRGPAPGWPFCLAQLAWGHRFTATRMAAPRIHTTGGPKTGPPNQRMKLSACDRRFRRNAQRRLFILSAASAGRSLCAFR